MEDPLAEDPTLGPVEDEVVDAGAPQELVELVDFLVDPKPAVRQQAVDIVCGVAGSDDGPNRLIPVAGKLVALLLRMLGGREEEAKAAAAALVNLSADQRHCDRMVKAGVVRRVVDSLKEVVCPHREALAMLLSNVTLATAGAERLLQLQDDETLHGLHLARVVAAVANSERASEQQRNELRHLGGALANVARTPQGRDLLLAPGTGHLLTLLPQLKSKVWERRAAVASLLKNLCMDRGRSVPALLQEGGALLLPALLAPISGTGEPSVEVRTALAEAVQCLAGTEKGFDALWSAGAPELLRKGYAEEEAPGVCEAMEATAELFMTHNRFDNVDKEEGGGDGHDSDEEDRRLKELSSITINTSL